MDEFPVRVGPSQVTMFEVLPGVAGESSRLESALRRHAPDVVCIEAAIEDARIGREGWYASLLRTSLQDHGHRDPSSPFAAAVAWARSTGAEVVPLLGAPEQPGFFARRAAQKAVTGGRLPGPEPRALAVAVRNAAAASHRDVTRLLHLGEESMSRRLATILVDEQRTRVAFVVTVPRSERVAGLLVGRPIAREVAKIGHE